MYGLHAHELCCRRTFHAIGDKELLLKKLEEVAAELSEDMERTGWTGKTLTLKYKLDTYQGVHAPSHIRPMITYIPPIVFTRAKSFDRWISTKKEDLFAVSTAHIANSQGSLTICVYISCLQTGKELLLPELPLRLRLIGLRVTKLKDLRDDADSKPGSIKRVCTILLCLSHARP